uniref:Putative lipocalin-5 1 n=1 Tax=Amblyomma triste TaxID=251400 RepID=A0A023GCX8_AMBTT
MLQKIMHCSYLLVLVALGQQLFLAATQDDSNIPDSFEIFKHFRSAVAISDINNDNTYECLTARRISLDMEDKTVEYIWLLKGHHNKPKKTVPLYIKAGSSPDTILYSVGSDDAPAEVGTFLYTDYENCAVLSMPYNGGQCILWAQNDKKDSVPQKCLEEFSERCGTGVLLYSKELCPDKEFLDL